MTAAARDAQRRAQRVNGIFGWPGFYPFKPLPGGSEIMPRVFLECPAAAPSGAAHLQTAVLGLQRFERAGHLAGGQGFELLLPLLQALHVEAQFGGNLPGGLAADQPVRDGRAFEGFIVAFVFTGRGGLFVGVKVVVPSSHNHTSPAHTIGATPV